MKRNYLLVSLLLFFVNFDLQSQEKNIIESTSKETFAEKIYLQLSSTVFTTNETIWFKAIVTQMNNCPTELSRILHVELIDFDKRIVEKKTLRLQKGIANSFFHLSKKHVSGRYLIRAYTEWNKNFNQDFIFNQYLNLYTPKTISKTNDPIKNIVLTEINENELSLSSTIHPKLIDPKFRGKLKIFIDIDGKNDSILLRKNKKGIYNFKYTLSKESMQAKLKIALEGIKLKNNKLGFVNSFTKTIIIDNEKLDLQFFPEGGHLIDGFLSIVGFKALNYKGKGTNITGTIVDEQGNKLTTFKSNHLGMGAFTIKGHLNKKYYGEIINSHGITYKYPLPPIIYTGYTLQVRQTNSHIYAKVKTHATKNDSLLIKITSRGKSNFIKVKQNNGLSTIALEKNNLPEGIIKLSVFNKNLNIECERLVFNLKDNKRLNINVTTDQKSYIQRGKTTLNINIKNNNNLLLEPNISILVLNKKNIGDVYNSQQNILSYFLLSSELKGTIETPKYYFDKKNKTRIQDLDVLLLTQGWRSYKFSNQSMETSIFKTPPETNLHVSGSIGEFFNTYKKKKKDVLLTMMSFGEPKGLYSKVMDSTGRFHFNLNDTFKNELRILIQTVDKKGKKKDYTINLDKKTAPKIKYKKQNNIQLPDSLIANYIEKQIEKKEAEKIFETANGSIKLDEVKLSGYLLTPEREKMMDLHGAPDIVIEDKELHKEVKSWSFGLFSVLRSSYHDDVDIEGYGDNLTANAKGAKFTFIIIDGIPVKAEDYSLLASLPTKEIKSIEIIKHPKNSRKYLTDVFEDLRQLPFAFHDILSFINIYTYSKKGLYGIQRSKGIYKGVISGFSEPLDFYAPKYETSSDINWKQPDLRTVMHWNADLKPDAQGNFETTFYNSDDIGDMLVIIETITRDGKIGYKEITYTVHKN